jgi:hypothetical protein
MSSGQHSLMRDTGDPYALGHPSKKDDMLALLLPVKAGADIFAGTPWHGIVGQFLATGFQLVEVTNRLVFTPGAEGISANAQQIGFEGGKNETRPQSELRGKAERLPDAGKNIALCHAAGIAFINGRSQVCKFCLVLLLLTFQRPQSGAYHFAGVLVTSALNFRPYKMVEFIGQINIARRHAWRSFAGLGHFGLIVTWLAKIANML